MPTDHSGTGILRTSFDCPARRHYFRSSRAQYCDRSDQMAAGESMRHPSEFHYATRGLGGR